MQNMYNQAKKFGARFISESAISVDLNKKIISLPTQDIQAEAIIVATGASPKMLNIPGEKEFYGGKGVSSCATCDGAFYKNKEVVVIGGGDSACEEALFLTRFCSKVYLIHRRDQLRASEVMANRVKAHEKIEILWDTIPVEILGSDKVDAIKLNHKINGEYILPCSCVFLGIGHIPNTKIFENQLTLDADGYIISNGVISNIDGVFVAGDCCDKIYRQAITSAAMGAMAAISAERYIKA
jgi:thioredoxin reductase (NADPH)